MCLKQLVRVDEVDDDSGVATGVVDGRSTTVSLVILRLDGVAVEPGDWLLVHTGVAVGRLDADDARRLLAARADLTEEEP